MTVVDYKVISFSNILDMYSTTLMFVDLPISNQPTRQWTGPFIVKPKIIQITEIYYFPV